MRSERSPCTIRQPAGLQERTALVGLLAADVVAPDGGPVEGRADLWADVSTRLREIAVADGDLGTAHQWAARVLAHERDTGTPSAIAVALVTLATVEIKLNDPACVGHLTEAGRLMNGVEHPDQLLAAMHYHLGMAYQDVDAIHDLNRAYAEYGKSEELQHPNNRTNQAKCVSQRAQILVEAGRDDPEHAAAYLAEAMRDTVTALQLFAPDDAANQAIGTRLARSTGYPAAGPMLLATTPRPGRCLRPATSSARRQAASMWRSICTALAIPTTAGLCGGGGSSVAALASGAGRARIWPGSILRNLTVARQRRGATVGQMV